MTQKGRSFFTHKLLCTLIVRVAQERTSGECANCKFRRRSASEHSGPHPFTGGEANYLTKTRRQWSSVSNDNVFRRLSLNSVTNIFLDFRNKVRKTIISISSGNCRDGELSTGAALVHLLLAKRQQNAILGQHSEIDEGRCEREQAEILYEKLSTCLNSRPCTIMMNRSDSSWVQISVTSSMNNNAEMETPHGSSIW